MAAKLRCPHCDGPFANAARSAVTKACCPHCGGAVRVPNTTGPDDRGEDEDRPRRKKRRAQSNTGLVVGLILGGVGVLALVLVLVLGVSLGWFSAAGNAPAPGPFGDEDPFQGERPKPRGPSQELQRVYDKILIERLPLQGVEKLLGPGREVPPAEIDALFDGVAFKKQIFERFVKNRQDLKVQRWLTWERDGTLLIVGMSRFRDGTLGISMRGMWNEGNRAFFDMATGAHPADIQ